MLSAGIGHGGVQIQIRQEALQMKQILAHQKATKGGVKIHTNFGKTRSGGSVNGGTIATAAEGHGDNVDKFANHGQVLTKGGINTLQVFQEFLLLMIPGSDHELSLPLNGHSFEEILTELGLKFLKGRVGARKPPTSQEGMGHGIPALTYGIIIRGVAKAIQWVDIQPPLDMQPH